MSNTHITIGAHFANLVQNNRIIKEIVLLNASQIELKNYLMYFSNVPNLLTQNCIEPLSNYLNGGAIPVLNYRSTTVEIVGADISFTCTYAPTNFSILETTTFLEIAQEWKTFLELPPSNGLLHLPTNRII